MCVCVALCRCPAVTQLNRGEEALSLKLCGLWLNTNNNTPTRVDHHRGLHASQSARIIEAIVEKQGF